MIKPNPYRFSTPPGWSSYNTAPHDGTIVELQNNFGIRPTFGLFHWVDGRGWVNAHQDFMGCGDGSYISWRHYYGTLEDYVDPTQGRQNTQEYWLEGLNYPPRVMDRLGMERPVSLKPRKRGFWAWLFGE